MKERPIIFRGDMVRAILDGRKTQTRRVVKVREHPQAERVQHFEGERWDWLRYDGLKLATFRCPYGQPGDRLWVRETFSMQHCVGWESPPFNDGRPVKWRDLSDIEGFTPVWVQPHYRATDPAPDLCCEREGCRQCETMGYGPHWKPSIHMPRWASRITLEITDVRVERLQDISEDDARAEGCRGNATTACGCEGLIEDYCCLWESINGPGSWDANPWVWVIEFQPREILLGPKPHTAQADNRMDG